MDLTQFVAAGGIIGLFSASAIVLFRAMGYESSMTERFQGQINDLSKEVEDLKEEASRCARVNHALIITLQRNNIEVPPEAWLT